MTMTRRAAVLGLAATGLMVQTAKAQPVQLTIRVNLPFTREQTGTLSLEDASGTAILSELKTLGKADNAAAKQAGNASRDPTLPFGDTPEGTYSVPRLVATGGGTAYSAHSYGPNGALVLKPETGDAAAAAANGRRGLLVHGGDPGAGGRPRATHGCLRLSNSDMARLMQAIANAGNNVTFNRCEVVRLSVLVGEDSAEGAGDDELDPPFDIDNLLNPVPISKP